LYVKAIVSKQRNVASHYSATFQTLLDTLKRTITKVDLPKKSVWPTTVYSGHIQKTVVGHHF